MHAALQSCKAAGALALCRKFVALVTVHEPAQDAKLMSHLVLQVILEAW